MGTDDPVSTGENEGNGIKFRHTTELSPKELLAIGSIVAQWGFLEYEIFEQTLLSFPEEEGASFPKQMSNTSFSQMLDLWKERVADNASGQRKSVLQREYAKIKSLQDYRNALIHGMFEWHMNAPDKLTSIRVKKKSVVKVHFDPGALDDFADRVSEINFNIRCPGGLEDLAEQQGGGSMSRHWVAMMTGNPVATELFPWISLDEDPPT